MKTARQTILALVLLLPLPMLGQSLTGLWTGALSNDSTTVRKDQSFEIALTQYKDKVYGFSRSTFIVNDTLYYIVKRVKGTIDGDICEVEDDKVISHNFPRKPEKGVKVISTFRRNPDDSTWSMDGEWKTNKTKKYYSISGKVALKEEKNYEVSKIFPHLEELGLAKEVAFYRESQEAPKSIAIDQSSLTKVERKTEPLLDRKTEKAPVMRPDEVEKRSSEATANNTIRQQKEMAALEAERKKEEEAKKNIAMAPSPRKEEVKTPIKQSPPQVMQPEKKKPEAPPATTTSAITKKPVEEEKLAAIPEKQKEPVTPISGAELPQAKSSEKPAAPTMNALPPISAKVAERKIATPQVLTYTSDSLELSLYDNGEVDGDTVSVFLNGRVILDRQGLKASAIRKTIYVPAGAEDSLTLVLYAENLGSYPPNTGLLVVRDGDEVHQVRFSADFTQNAAVIFKRRKK